MILSILLAAFLIQSPKPKAPGEDWVSLYNGKDLTGWVNVGHEKWEPEPDGILHGVAVTKEYGYLQTEKSYKDFQMSLRFKCEGDGNSGVFFHTWFKAGHCRRHQRSAVRNRLHVGQAHWRRLRAKARLDRLARP